MAPRKSMMRYLEILLFVVTVYIFFISPIADNLMHVHTSYDFDMLIKNNWASIFLLNFAIMTVVEALFGYMIFFRTLRGLISVIAANIISYPLFVFWIHLSANYLLLGRYVFGDPVIAMIFGAIGILVIEAVVIKIIIKGEITKWGAFRVSFDLNWLIGVIYMLSRVFL